MNVAITSSSLRKEKKRNHQPAVDASSNEFIVFEFWCYRFLLFKKKKFFYEFFTNSGIDKRKQRKFTNLGKMLML